MSIFLLNLILAFAWSALLGEFTTINFLVGFGLGYFMLWVSQYVMETSSYFGKMRQIISLIFVFLWALIVANLRVAYSVLAPLNKMRPGIVAIPLDIEQDAEITLLANMITLTPGTLSLDVSDDKRILYVHGMHVYGLDEFRREIKDGFETKVREAFE